MRIVELNGHVAVSEQITPEHVPVIAAAGYRVLLNNRPDGEVPGQPTSESFRAAAEAAGMSYHYLPVTAMDFPGPDIHTMKQLFNDPQRPVLAFCRSGTRCTNLWIASRADEEVEAARLRARQLGYDIAMSMSR
jgi:uncharacterized protein (TIGR01244 family)